LRFRPLALVVFGAYDSYPTRSIFQNNEYAYCTTSRRYFVRTQWGTQTHEYITRRINVTKGLCGANNTNSKWRRARAIQLSLSLCRCNRTPARQRTRSGRDRTPFMKLYCSCNCTAAFALKLWPKDARLCFNCIHKV